jgi:ornithine cyclodeaminase
MRYLGDNDVAACLQWDTSLDVLDAAFRSFADGSAAIAPRSRLGAGGAKISTLVAVLPAQGVAGAKVYSTTPEGRFSFLVLLFSTDDGAPLAVLSADALTRVRTAAVSLLAARALAAPDPRVLTVFGAGVQARAHAEAFVREFQPAEVRLVLRSPSPTLGDQLETELGVPVQVGSDPVRALDGADLVVLATRATEPLFDGSLLAPGMHVTATGATRPDVRELDEEAVGRCDRVVVEWTPQVQQEAGGLIAAAERGRLDWGRVAELGPLLTGRVQGRTSSDEITLFKSVGIALEDVAVAAAVLEVARAQGRGVELG